MRRSFILPHLTQLSSLLMDSIGSLQADAVVRTPGVVELDEAPNLFLGLLVRLEAILLTIQLLYLIVPFTRSAMTLSVGLWSSVIEISIPYLCSSSTYRSQQYCTPLSKWWIRPERSPPPVCPMAIRRALSVKTADRESVRHQPTIFFE